MAYEKPVQIHSFEANTTLSTQFVFVYVLSTGKVDVPTTVTQKPIGVLQNDPVTGGAAEVMISGISKLLAASTIAAGARLSASASGLATVATTGTFAVGTALSAAAAANDIITAAIECAVAGTSAT